MRGQREYPLGSPKTGFLLHFHQKLANLEIGSQREKKYPLGSQREYPLRSPKSWFVVSFLWFSLERADLYAGGQMEYPLGAQRKWPLGSTLWEAKGSTIPFEKPWNIDFLCFFIGFAWFCFVFHWFSQVFLGFHPNRTNFYSNCPFCGGITL